MHYYASFNAFNILQPKHLNLRFEAGKNPRHNPPCSISSIRSCFISPFPASLEGLETCKGCPSTAENSHLVGFHHQFSSITAPPFLDESHPTSQNNGGSTFPKVFFFCWPSWFQVSAREPSYFGAIHVQSHPHL